MALITPNSKISTTPLPSLTYKIDLKNNAITGLCDEIEALKQGIYFALQTTRFAYEIYSWNYGCEIENVIGKDRWLFETEAKRYIVEALVQDDRIKDVSNFSFDYNNGSVLITFEVMSTLGNITSEIDVGSIV